MNSIDRELAQAIDAAPADGAGPDPKAAAKPKRNLGLLLSLGAMAGGIVVLAFISGEGATYAKSVDQLVADRGRMAGRAVRVQGDLVRGSLSYQEQTCEYRFRMTQNGVELPVHYTTCAAPDTFRDTPEGNVEVTAEGKLSSDGGFEAEHVMAKCPSKRGYQPLGSGGTPQAL
jgi:cytochrome c-type biogenesis protein CcmE